MKFVELKVGDTAWFYIGNHDGELTDGEVLAIVDLPGYSFSHYIIEISTHVDCYPIIRDGLGVSDAADKPIGLWRNNAISKNSLPSWSD